MKSTGRIQRQMYPPVFVLPALVLYLFFFLLPNVSSLFLGFTNWSRFDIMHPKYIGLYNFRQLLVYPYFTKSIVNTLYFATVSTILMMFMGYVLALMLNGRLFLKNIHRTIIFSPIVMNFMATGMIFANLVLSPYGIIDKLLRWIGLDSWALPWLALPRYAMLGVLLMNTWMTVGGGMIIFLAALQSIPHMYYEAAIIDGANSIQKFMHITVPMSLQGITINLIFGIVAGTKVFGQVYFLTNGGPNDSTQVFGTFMFGAFSEGLYGFGCAAQFLFSVVILLVTVLILKYMTKREVQQ